MPLWQALSVQTHRRCCLIWPSVYGQRPMSSVLSADSAQPVHAFLLRGNWRVQALATTLEVSLECHHWSQNSWEAHLPWRTPQQALLDCCKPVKQTHTIMQGTLESKMTSVLCDFKLRVFVRLSASYLYSVLDSFQVVIWPYLHFILAILRRIQGWHADLWLTIEGWQHDVGHIEILPTISANTSAQALCSQYLQTATCCWKYCNVTM